MNPPPLIAVLGPTASGKSAIAHRLALEIDGEIVSCDSMQIYRELEIGTAQPSVQEREEVPHHLIGEIEFHQPWNAFKHKTEARRRIEAIRARNRFPLLVGGTGMYAKSILYDLPLFPADPIVSAEIFDTAKTETGRDRLAAELHAAAPERDFPEDLCLNPRRLARAIEILRLTGNLPENLGTLPNDCVQPIPNSMQFVILPPDDEHRRRIHERTRAMLETGWIEETKALAERGFFASSTARQALGYQRVRDFLDGIIPNREELTRTIVGDTWKYARKQRTWFRHQHPGAHLLTLRHDLDAGEICDALAPLVTA